MALLKRSAFTSIPRKTVEVEIPELKGFVRLREMNGTERDTFEVSAFRDNGDGKTRIDPMYLRARLVARCLVDEADKRIYGDDEIEQLSQDFPASILGRLFDAAQKLNGVDPAAVETAKKDSSATPAGASTSASH
jgi:hypothetical protein